MAHPRPLAPPIDRHPGALRGFFFVSTYLYLLIAGRNTPLRVYDIVVAMAAYGVYSAIRKFKQQTTKVHGA